MLELKELLRKTNLDEARDFVTHELSSRLRDHNVGQQCCEDLSQYLLTYWANDAFASTFYRKQVSILV